MMSRAFVATTILLSATIVIDHLTARRVPERLALPLDSIESQILDWRMVENQQLDESELKVLAPTAYLARTYRKKGVLLNLFIAFYAQQRAGESMHSPKHCLPGTGWEIWRMGRMSIPVNGHDVVVNEDQIENSGMTWLMLYWYQSRNKIIASEYVGKLLLARDTLLTGRTAASIVRIILPDIPNGSAEGSAFASVIATKLQICLGR